MRNPIVFATQKLPSVSVFIKLPRPKKETDTTITLMKANNVYIRLGVSEVQFHEY